MNTLQEMIDVMTAARDGKTIEAKEKGYHVWHVCNRPVWDWFNAEYRVKPEPPKPREFYANMYSDGTFGKLWQTYEAAKQSQEICRGGATVIKLIEVR